MICINSNKLDKLKINSENTYFVIDFDRTVTSDESRDSWDIAREFLGDGIKKEMNLLYEKYRPIEINYKIPIEEKLKEMEKWYVACMSLYYKYHLTKNKIIQSLDTGKIFFREGAKDFFNYANQKNIPVIILSAGIANVIEEFLKKEKCFFENIYIIGNFIEFDENGEIKEFDNSKIIHTLNKSLVGKLNEEQYNKLKNKPYKILIGDMIEDTNMINKDEWDSTLKIGILNKETEDLIEVYKPFFDIILTRKRCLFSTNIETF